MAITSSVYPFSDYTINYVAPANPGVYALYDGNQLIYYGASDKSIRDRLRSHKGGYMGPCTQYATHVNWEVTRWPFAREQELLREFKQAYGRLPRCNDRIG